MACADIDMNIHDSDEESDGEEYRNVSKIWRYIPQEVVPEVKGPLHDLLQKQPAAFGIMSGLVSMGLGIIFAVVPEFEISLITLFRISHLCGFLFIFAGFMSIHLFKYPQLLQVSLTINCGCIAVATIAICLIIVDLSYWTPVNQQFFKLEMLELCVLAFKVILSGILCHCFLKEKRSKTP